MTISLKHGIAALAAFAILSLGLPAFASQHNWELNEDTTITFVCGGADYVHTLDEVTQNEDGTFTGTGFYNTNPGYTWDVEGEITGDDITYTITYTGLAEGSQYTNTGTIAADGSIEGTSTSNCQTFTSPAGTATEVEDEPEFVVPTTKEECKNGGWMTLTDQNGVAFKNQGQCVSFVAAAKGV